MNDRIEIINFSSRFLNFYNQAQAGGLDAEDAFVLWKEQYGFAAVPPGDEGQKEAYRLFIQAYDKYKGAIGRIESFVPDEAFLHNTLGEIKELLGYKDGIDIAILYYVGFFENNAFVAPYTDGKLALCLPIETDRGEAHEKNILVHELTHIVHIKASNSNGGWIRPLGTVIIQEGLAMKVSQKLANGLESYQYLTNDYQWFVECQKIEDEIISKIKPYIRSDKSEILFKFTMGNGNTGHQREVYYTAWVLFEKLLEKGYTYEQIAHIDEAKMLPFVEEHIESI